MAKFYSGNPIVISDVKPSLRQTLSRLPDQYHVCFEFKVDVGFDVMILHPKGIHVIEVKNENRQIIGGHTSATWEIRGASGRLEAERDTYYGQAMKQVGIIKKHFTRRSQYIFRSGCFPTPCSPDMLCDLHNQFWWDFEAFPYVCVPEWNPQNKVSMDNWCSLVQGNSEVDFPPFIVDEVLKRDWTLKESTARLELSESEIQRAIKVSSCMSVSLATAMGRPNVWTPTLDELVDPRSRVSELDELMTQLQREKVVAVVGEPKTGKSTLCQLLASELNEHEIPIWDYDFRLAGYSGRFGSAQMFEKIQNDAKMPSQQTIQDDIRAILGVLTNQSRLLIIDNFETAIDDKNLQIADPTMARFVELLISSAQRLQGFVLFTSTTPFFAANHARPSIYSIPGINHDFAIEYLTRYPFKWTQDQADQIYGIRPGNPLSMVMASRIMEGYMGELGTTFEKAFSDCASEVAELTYGASYSKFSDAERDTAELLALHPDGMNVDSMRQILRNLDFHGNVLGTLMQLSGRSALTKTTDNRFKLRPQDRQYVYDRIEQPARLHRAVLGYLQSLPCDDLAIETPSIRQQHERIFFHAIQSNQVGAAFDAFTRLKKYSASSGALEGPISMAIQLSENVNFPDLPALDRAQVLLSLGRAFRHIGDIDSSVNSLEKARLTFEEARDDVWQAWALSDLGLTKRKQGKYLEELKHYDDALEVLKDETRVEAKRARSSILGRKGHALQRKGEPREVVLELLNKALNLARESEDPRLIVTRLAILGAAYRESGQRDIPSAMTCFDEAVQLSESTEGHPELAGVVAGLAKTYEKARQPQVALPLYVRAHELTNKNDQFGMLDRLGTLGHVHKVLGRLTEAEEFFRQALILADTLQNQKAEAENLDELGALYRQMAQREEDARTSQPKKATVDNCADQGTVYRSRALTEQNGAKQAELLKEALRCHETAVEIQRQLPGDPSGLANRLQELGRTFMALEKYPNAFRCFVEAVHNSRMARKTHLEAWQFYRLAQVFQTIGAPVPAYLCYQHAIGLNLDEMRHLKKKARSLFNALPPLARGEVVKKLRSLDEEIETLLTADLGRENTRN